MGLSKREGVKCGREGVKCGRKGVVRNVNYIQIWKYFVVEEI